MSHIMVDALASRDDAVARDVVRELREAGLRVTHHLVCRGCGRTEDTGCLVGERRCLEPGNEHEYVIERAEVVFWGLCPACQAARA